MARLADDHDEHPDTARTDVEKRNAWRIGRGSEPSTGSAPQARLRLTLSRLCPLPQFAFSVHVPVSSETRQGLVPERPTHLSARLPPTVARRVRNHPDPQNIRGNSLTPQRGKPAL